MKSSQRKTLFLCALGLGCVLFFLLLLPRLSEGTLWHTDEAYTAERSREMLLLNDYANVHLYFEPSFNKPPLQYYLTTLSMRLFDDPELCVRIWSLLYATGCLILIAWVYLQLRPEKYIEAFAAAFFVATYPHFVDNARLGLLDMGALFYLLLTLLGSFKALRNPKTGWLLAGVAAGLGCWQKNTLSLGALTVVSLFFACWKETRASMRNRWWFYGILLALSIGLAWPVLQFISHPADYSAALQKDWSHLTTQDAFIDPQDYFLYLKWMARKWGPVSLLALIAIMGSIVSPVIRKERRLVIIISLAVGYILTISLFKFKRNYYVLPAIPFLSITLVYFYASIWRTKTWLLYSLYAGCGFTTILLSAYHYMRPSKDYAPQVALIREVARTADASEALCFICKDRHFESIESLFPAFVLYYGQLNRPIAAHTLRSLSRLPAGTPACGILYAGVFEEAKPFFIDYQELAHNGDYIAFRARRSER